MTATDNSATPLTVTANTTVAAAAVASQISLRLPADVQAGQPVPLWLMVVDAQGFPVPNYSGTVTLASSDTGAVFSSTTVTFNNGFPQLQGPVTVTFATPGAQTVTATDNSATPLTVTANTTVAAAAVASQIKFQLPPSVQAGQPIPLWIMVTDAQGNPVPSYSGTVTLTSSDSGAVFSSGTVTFKNGFPASAIPATVTFATAGAQTVTATDNSATPLTVTANTTVAAAAVASQIKLQLPPSVQAGQPIPLPIMVTDAQGNPVPGYSGTVTLASSDSGAVFSASTVTFKNGVPASATPVTVTFATAGAQTVTATDNSATPLTVTANTTVAAAAVASQIQLQLPPSVQAGQPIPLWIMVTDAQGNPVPSYSGTVALTSSDSGAVFSSSTVTFKNGFPASATPVTVTFATSGSQTVTATDNSATPLTVAANTTVAATAVASQIQVFVPTNVNKGVAVPIFIMVEDAQGQPVPTYSGTVTLTSSDAGAVFSTTTITFDNGVPLLNAPVMVTFATAGAQTVTATDNSTSPLTVTVKTSVS